MIYAKVSSADRSLLQNELLSTKDAKWYRRLKVIDLSSVGLPVQKLAEMFDLSKNAVVPPLSPQRPSALTSIDTIPVAFWHSGEGLVRGGR